MQLKWTDLAAQDLEKIESYIAQESSPTIAIDVVLSIINTATLILPRHPRAGRKAVLKTRVNSSSMVCPLYSSIEKRLTVSTCLELCIARSSGQRHSQFPVANTTEPWHDLSYRAMVEHQACQRAGNHNLRFSQSGR